MTNGNDEAFERLLRNPETMRKLEQAERNLADGKFVTLTVGDVE